MQSQQSQVSNKVPVQRHTRPRAHVKVRSVSCRLTGPSDSSIRKGWVTDITCIWLHEGWLHPGVVVDLFSRNIIGGSMQFRMIKDIVLYALSVAV